MAQHDLIFFEKRSTPKVVTQGKRFVAPEGYGKQTRRRAATADEEKIIARGDWLRVDQSGKKGGTSGYKRTKMKSRQHLLTHNQTFDTPRDALMHYGKKGMKWGVINEDKTGSNADAKPISENRKQKAAAAREKVSESKALAKEMDDLGINSPEMRRLYGKGVERSDRLFAVMYGQSKDQAVQKQIKFELDRAAQQQKASEQLESGKLTSNQKKAIVGGLAAAAVIGYVGYTSYSDIRSGKAEPGQSINSRIFQKKYGETSEKFMATQHKSLASLDDTDLSIPAGTVFSRVTAFKDEKMEGRLYTTFADDDTAKYEGLYGPVLRQRTGQKELYVSRMKMGTEIRSPSHRKRVQAYLDLINESDPPKTPSMRADNENIALRQYNNFARGIVQPGPLTDRYFKRIQDMGYNALIDDNDAGQLSRLPIILLTPKKDMSSRTVTPLTVKREREARKRLTEIHRIDEQHAAIDVPDQYKAPRRPRQPALVGAP